MKLYKAIHDGVCLGGVSIAIAETEEEAKQMIIEELKKEGIENEGIEIEEIDLNIKKAYVLSAGEY